MRKNTIFLILLVAVLSLFLFVACGKSPVIPPNDLSERPSDTEAQSSTTQTTPSITDTSAPQSQRATPLYWVGESATLPDSLLPATEPVETGTGEGAADTTRPSVTTTPQVHTTVSIQDPSGNGRGDAYEVQGTNEYGVSVTIECTPFY